MDERKRQLLDQVEKEMAEVFDGTTVFDGAELDSPVDMLRILETGYGSALTEVLGEFYFNPNNEEDELWVFSGTVVFTDQLEEKYIPLLAEALVKMNFYLPIGGFAINAPGKLLSYRIHQTIRISDSDESILEQMRTLINMAFGVPQPYCGVLLKMSEGNVTMEEFSVLFP